MEQTLQLLDGVFAFCLIDYRFSETSSKTYIARDPYGVRPLYIMKRILTLISVFALLVTACEGPQGPPGFDGFDGEIIASSAFEIDPDPSLSPTHTSTPDSFRFKAWACPCDP